MPILCYNNVQQPNSWGKTLLHPPVGGGVNVTLLCLWSLITFCLLSPHRFNFEDETPTTNFDTFPAAILTVFQVKVNSIMLLFSFFNCTAEPDSATSLCLHCRSWQGRTGTQSCTMGLNHRGAFTGECSPLFISSFSLSLETVSWSIDPNWSRFVAVRQPYSTVKELIIA